MARIDKKKELRPSILDRLIDDQPHISVEAERRRHQLIDELRNSVRRDLENLFNTRYRVAEWDSRYEELERSLVNYGLPDLATVNIVDQDAKRQFTSFLEQTIKGFEPRFQSVKVVPLNNAEESDRTLRFRIEATLYADPIPEQVTFNSVLEPVTRTVSIKEADHD